MEKIPTLPVYDTTPEGEADRRVDQGCGAYYDYGYGVDGDRPERSGGYRVAESGLIGEICGAEVDIGLMESRLNLI